MKNRAVLKFFLIYFGFTITSNFVHPITPAFLQTINAPSYIQGVAFSVMSFFTFLTAPFWGIRKHIRVSAICAGVNTNANGQALDTDGNVIDGLYCVGNVGGVFYGGADYPFHQTGLSLGRCYTFGMLAAKHAMGQL